MDTENQNTITICSPQYGDLIKGPTAGGGVFDFEILKRLASFPDFKVHILMAKGRKASAKLAPAEIYFFEPGFLAKSYLFNFVMLPKLWQTYQQTHFKILRVHSPYFIGIGAWLFKKIYPVVKTIAIYHHIEKKFIFDVIDKLLIHSWDIIFVPSNTTKQELIAKYHVPAEKIYIIYSGVDEALKPYSKNIKLLELLGVMPGAPVLLFAGSVIARKNPEFLIKVLARLRIDYRLNPSLLLAGSVKTTYKNQLIQLATDCDVKDQLFFTGKFSSYSKNDLYNLCDIFVFPSLQEGFGLTPLEAMLCEKPVIVSDKGALPELQEDGKSGFVVALDEALWAKKIKVLLDNETLRTEIGKKARAHVLNNFSWDRSAKMQEEIIREIAKNL